MSQSTGSEPVSDRIAHFPIAFFAMIMGSGGLTLAWQKAAHSLSGVPEVISQILLLLTLSLFGWILLNYGRKFSKARPQVLAEFNHPIKISFFPAFSIGLILVSIALLPISKGTSLVFLLIGAPLHLLFTLHVMSQWIHHQKFQVQHSTPAWFIPVVGNILIPISAVEHGFIELSWFFFSIGMIYWLVLKTLIFNRVIFHDPLPEKLLPTLFILIAPPAVGFLSYLKLNHGELDNFAHILYYAAMFLLLLLLSQFSHFKKIPFFLSWWAYSFPIAAATISTLTMYEITGKIGFGILASIMLILTSGLIGYLYYRTYLAVKSGKVFLPD